jgi:hypothetical protein
MITSSLYAANEFTQSVISSVTCMLLSPGDDVSRQINLPFSYSSIRLHFKCSVVSGSDIMSGLFFYGFCSRGHSRLNLGNECCIGGQTFWDGGLANNMPAPDSFGWQHATDVNTNPANSVIGWTVNEFSFAKVTGSLYKPQNGFSGFFIPKYETVWSSSYSFASASTYPWQMRAFEYRPNALNDQIFDQAWDGYISNYPNVARGVYLDAVQTTTWIYSNYVCNDGLVEQGLARNNSTVVLGSPFVNINTAVYGIIDSVNFYWTSSNPNAKIAIRDVNVVVR